MMTLKDAKKLNLDDEIKGDLVKVLTKHLKSLIKENLLKEEVEEAAERKAEHGVERERELFATLNSFKSNYRDEFSQSLVTLLMNKKSITSNQLKYVFKLFELLFEIHDKNGQKNHKIIKNYIKLCDTFVLAREEITDGDLLCTIYNAHIAMLKCNKEQLDANITDYVFTFYMEPRNRPVSSDVEDFCKFNEAVGQFFYVIGSFHQKYFKSRIPQFFKAYAKFLNEIYFYKADDEDDLEPKQIIMLSRLTLQLEKYVH